MEKKVLTGKQSRERWLLKWLPVAAVPLLTLLFWIGGGGKGHAAMVTAAGFLKRLPGAFVAPVTRLDKMGYYDLAKRDSMTARQRMVVQSNYARQLGLAEDSGVSVRHSAGVVDAGVMRVRAKLEQLKRVVSGGGDVGQSGAPVGGIPVRAPAVGQLGRLRQGSDLGQLERVMNGLQRDDGGGAEMRELNVVVEKLLALQRSVADTGTRVVAGHGMVGSVREVSERQVLSVRVLPDEEDTVGRFDSGQIEAIVPEDVVLVSGGELRLELVHDVQIGRQRVPAGTVVFGVTSLSGERLLVETSTIACEGRLFPVRLEVEDEDGMPGIYIPGAPVSEALRESAGQELGALGSGMVSTNLAGQAAGAGVVLARSLIGKKVRPVKVTIPAGYRVLLHAKNAGI